MQRATAAVRLLAGDKEPVRLASTGNLALSGLLTVDGVVTAAGDRVLAKDQTDATENGIYTASEGTWYRAPDASSSRSLIAGMKVAVQLGTAHGGDVWNLDTNRPDLGDDAIEFSLYLNTTIADDINAARESLVAEMDAIIATGLAAGKATQPEAEAGSSNVGWMTPLRVYQALQSLFASVYAAFVGKVHQYDTRALAMAATIPVGALNVVVMREAAGYPLSRAPYIPGSSSGPRAFQDAGGNWWELDITVADFNWQWMGTKGNGTVNDTTACQGAIDLIFARGGGVVRAPNGNYSVPGGIVVKAGVRLVGESRDGTVIQAWHTDVLTVRLTGDKAGLENLSIYGKGVNSDTGTFGATQNALQVDCSNGVFRDVRSWGGAGALYITGVDNDFDHVETAQGYGSSNVSMIGANWFIRCKFDHDATGISPIDSQPYAAWAALQGVSVGSVRIVSSYALICSVAGATGAVAPTLKNYGVPITDGSATWLLFGPQSYVGALLGTSCGENHFTQCDFSGSAYTQSIQVNMAAPFTNGPAVASFDECVMSHQVNIVAGKWVKISGCELAGDINIQPGYAGVCHVIDNYGVVSGTTVQVSSNVSGFFIRGNYLSSGAINVAAGTSDNYIITGNVGATISDGGTGVNKSVTGNVG
jgi:hypothetical protein